MSAEINPGARRRGITRGAAFVGAAAGFFIVTVAAGVPTPLFVVYEQRWHFPASLLTAAFASYAIGVIITVLVAGSLSDHIGRRPVLLVALAVQLVAMLLFVGAQDIGWIIGARALQGVAAGLASSPFTAYLLELAPDHRRTLGAVMGGAIPTAGLALGALGSGLIVQAGAATPSQIFAALTAITVIIVVVVALSPETNDGRPGAIASLKPRVAIPVAARSTFRATVPSLAAAWMFVGFALALAPSLIQDVIGIRSGGLNGLAAFLPPALATLASLAAVRLSPRGTRLWGTTLVIAGAALAVTGISFALLPVIFIGFAVGGLGFGATFSGTLRTLVLLVGPAERAGLLAGIFLVAYLSYGVPAFVAGLVIQVSGLFAVSIGYLVVVSMLAAAGLIAQLRAERKVG